MEQKVRIDKWLWAVRIYKTRSIAAEACKKGRVFVNDQPAKPSREIIAGDVVIVRKPPVVYTYKVKEANEKRVSAKLVENLLEDLTTSEEIDKLNIRETVSFYRDRGTGRPTKKDRREIDKLRNTD